MAGDVFTLAINQFRVKTEQKMLQTIRWICLELSSRVIMRTPVDTGRARGSWTPSVGAARGSGGNLDKSGTATLARVNTVLASFKLGDTFYLTSNLPYITVLEYGRYPDPPKKGSKTVGGYSRKAPQGMVRITLAEFPGIARSVGK